MGIFDGAKSGGPKILIDPDSIVDMHMHLQSGNCAPLPLLYGQVPLPIEGTGRGTLETLIEVFKHKAVHVSKMSIAEIADYVLKENREVFATDSKIVMNSEYKRANGIYTLMFVQPMDMDFAHIAGYPPTSRIIYRSGKILEIWYLRVKENNFQAKQYAFINYSAETVVLQDRRTVRRITVPVDDEQLTIDLQNNKSISIRNSAGQERNDLRASEKDGIYYFNRKSGTDQEEDGEFIDISGEKSASQKETDDKNTGDDDPLFESTHDIKFRVYKKQHDETIDVAVNHPFSFLPLFHYDPRRWINDSYGKSDEPKWSERKWDFPFTKIARPDQSGLFIGFKMYNPHGYKPLDPRLPHMWQYKNDKMECFYGRCEQLHIPILVHCSPGGMTTHEAIFYHQLDGVDLSTIPARTTIGYDPGSPLGYFYDNYVHPRNWRPVLAKFPKLRLCLAHFGGDEWSNSGLKSDWIEEIVDLTKVYDNVYTDMSCFDLQDEKEKNSFVEFFRLLKNGEKKYLHLRDKVMFGTDWFLTLLLGGPGNFFRPTDYKKFCEIFYETVKKEANYFYFGTIKHANLPLDI
jgi:hypothetical protein